MSLAVNFTVRPEAHVSLGKNGMAPLKWSELGTPVRPEPMNADNGKDPPWRALVEQRFAVSDASKCHQRRTPKPLGNNE